MTVSSSVPLGRDFSWVMAGTEGLSTIKFTLVSDWSAFISTRCSGVFWPRRSERLLTPSLLHSIIRRPGCYDGHTINARHQLMSSSATCLLRRGSKSRSTLVTRTFRCRPCAAHFHTAVDLLSDSVLTPSRASSLSLQYARNLLSSSQL